jgi:hypothetical protein
MQNLSLSLKKLHIFFKQFEFVGINVCQDGDCPAMSKHQLLQHWPTPFTMREVSKLVGFMHFYSRFIPHFEVRITALGCSPAPTELSIAPKHQHYFCSPCINMPHKASLQQTPPSAQVVEPTVGLQHLSNWPVSFGTHTLDDIRDHPKAPCLYNSEITRAAGMLTHFD